MYDFSGLAHFISFAFGAFFGVIGLCVAFVAGIWLDLPSWAYLASFGVPALISGIWFRLTSF